MELALIGSFLIMGFLGSWHCAAMCGPLCSNFKSQNDFISYQIGRLISYLIIGCLLFYGTHFFLDTDSRSIKLVATVIYGVIFIIFGLMQLSLIKNKRIQYKYAKLQFIIADKNRELIKKFPIVLGLLTGLFPCAWLYSFLFLSTQMHTITHALFLIFIFWFTALPAFIVFTGFMQNLIRFSPMSHQKISGVILIIAGIFAIIGHWI
ncbi:sulfite exporter TauE/SafE family protein [bacterium]|nr:sulfite exporter TauE/SafE family protein [bacterium]